MLCGIVRFALGKTPSRTKSWRTGYPTAIGGPLLHANACLLADRHAANVVGIAKSGCLPIWRSQSALTELDSHPIDTIESNSYRKFLCLLVATARLLCGKASAGRLTDSQ